MISQGQLGQSQGQVPPYVLVPPPATANPPLLGNASIQKRAPIPDLETVMEMYRTLLSGASPNVKLAMLKRQKFKESGRQERIRASLDALNAPQPTHLTLGQWKEVLAEEDED